jgi:hypothetical protein
MAIQAQIEANRRNALPEFEELEKLDHYGTSIHHQIDRALNRLAKLQAQRLATAANPKKLILRNEANPPAPVADTDLSDEPNSTPPAENIDFAKRSQPADDPVRTSYYAGGS